MPGRLEEPNYGAQLRTWGSRDCGARFRVRCCAPPRN